MMETGPLCAITGPGRGSSAMKIRVNPANYRVTMQYHCFHMARLSILAKLEAQLRDGIDNEVKIVYLLVQLRKLLEIEGEKQMYPVVNFYCNWVVHSKLSNSPIADTIIRQFDSYLQSLAITSTPFNDSIFPKEVSRLTDDKTLKHELELCLNHFGLPTEVCSLEAKWMLFKANLIGIIEDCPLTLMETKTQRTQYLKALSVKQGAEGPVWSFENHTPPHFREDENGTIVFLPTPPQP
jgi:hypothetical protein